MEFVTTVFIAIGLAMDCFAVSLGIGTGGRAVSARPVFRLSFHMGLFQGGMTLLGWLAGTTIASLVSQFAPWVAMGLLAFVGIRMVRSGLCTDLEECGPDPTRGWSLVMLSIATSIDAMAVGLSMAMLGTPVWVPSLVIGLTSALFALAGLKGGGLLGSRFGKRMEIAGGLLLNGIGLRILLTSFF